MKACPFCAEEIQEAAVKCRWCQSDLGSDGVLTKSLPVGPAVAIIRPPAALQATPGQGMAVAGLVLGIASFLIPVVCSVPAIIFGAIGIGNANKGAPGKGMAIAGLVLGIVTILGAIALVSGNG